MPHNFLLLMEVRLHTFKKTERLSKKKEVEELFTTGESFLKFPFRVVYKIKHAVEKFPVRVAISVPKKKIKRAVDRNRIKRLTREAYRLNKAELISACKAANISVDFMLIYTGNVNPEFTHIQTKLVLILQRLKTIVQNNALPDNSGS